MGVDYYATALVGCKIDKSKLYLLCTETVVPACNHPSATLHTFCPECGKPTTRKVRKPIPQFNEDSDLLCDLKVVWSTDNAEAFVCRVPASTQSSRSNSGPVMVQAPTYSDYESIKNVLEPLGLWQPALFGLWVVPYVSY